MIKFKSYTDEQINYIVENFCIMTNKEIAEKLNITDKKVAYVARKLNLVKQPHSKWKDEEIEYLKNNYNILTSEEMAKHLNRSVSSVNEKRGDLGLWNTESWSDEDIEFLKYNFMNMTHLEMGQILHRTDGAVRAKCFDLNLYKKELPWEDWELEFVKNNYMEMQTKEISEILNRTPSAVKLKAERMGYKKYPYSCDYNYFNNIDTEEKAYWLGFLSADGWINKNEETGSGVVGIELQYGDINHLKKFNKSISGNYKITDRWRTCELSPYHDKKNHMCILRIFSIKMYNDLVNLGFTNNKSFEVDIPDIDESLIRHFIRGYFDGNGCFTLTNKTFNLAFTTASYNLKTSLINILRNNGFDFCDNSMVTEYDTVIYNPTLNKKMQKLQFLDWMYENATIYLDRKYKRYLKAKQKYSSNGPVSQE